MILRIPSLLYDPDLWLAMAEKRGEEIASLNLADAVITIAPPYADAATVQEAIDAVLRTATRGKVSVRLVHEPSETAYRIGGGRYALETV